MQNNNTLGNDYNIIRFLGGGGFSKVYLITNKNNNNNQFVARIRISNEFTRGLDQDEN